MVSAPARYANRKAGFPARLLVLFCRDVMGGVILNVYRVSAREKLVNITNMVNWIAVTP